MSLLSLLRHPELRSNGAPLYHLGSKLIQIEHRQVPRELIVWVGCFEPIEDLLKAALLCHCWIVMLLKLNYMMLFMLLMKLTVLTRTSYG